MPIAGRVSVVPKGRYDPEAVYDRLDMVTFDNKLFVAKKTSNGIEPGNEENWMLAMKVPVSGVKGDREDEYRDGDVSISLKDLGYQEASEQTILDILDMDIDDIEMDDGVTEDDALSETDIESILNS